ncbi:MAG: sugar transferase [Candidatus Omnitrophota bacterium]|jgi:exopolysaccharide biosynthesis polyprenyl glycosylphosphotransferase
MLKEYTKVFRKLLVFADVCVISSAFYCACRIGLRLNLLRGGEPALQFLGGTLVIWLSSLYVFGMYNSFRIKPFKEIVLVIFQAAVIGFVVPVSVSYIFKPHTFSRDFIVLTVAFITLFLFAEKAVLVFIFRYIRRQGLNYRRVLIVGTNKRAQSFVELIEGHSEWGFRVLGFIDEDRSRTGRDVGKYKVLGGFDDVPDVIHEKVVDHVVFVVPRVWFDKIVGLITFCETEGIPVSLAVDMYDLKISRAKQTDLYGFPLLTFESTPDKLWHLLVKRVMDIVLSGVFLLVLAPFFAVIAVLIKRGSPGPAFFNQERCGLNGRKFIMYKFRTMVQGAETRLEELRAGNEMTGPAFKMSNDPRVTGIGRFLRKFSVDEFPQLWNVFKGDMSLVGPRPPLPSEVVKYDNWQRRRLSMKPGLTCLWQIRGRNAITDFDGWMRLDLEYIDRWSLLLDFRIILKTIPVVLLGRGAK